MTGDQMAEATQTPAGIATLEASDGPTLSHARDVAETGVDLLPAGALTHQVRVVDLGMDLK